MASTSLNLMNAAREWASRPSDERFWTLEDLYKSAKTHADESRIKDVELAQCKILTSGNDLMLAGPTYNDGGRAAEFNHYSFGQLCNVAHVPSGFLRTLPAELAAQNLNYGLSTVYGSHKLMFQQNGRLILRAATGVGYGRIWNYEVAELALMLQSRGWRVPPGRPCGLPNVPVRKATAEDVLRNAAHPSLGVKIGDDISPAGLYASAHDSFMFLINEDHPIKAGNGETLYRGIFFSNSEVGAGLLRITFFLFDSVCGNHIVWSATVVLDLSMKHTKNVRQRFDAAMYKIREQLNSSAADEEGRIYAAKQYLLGDTKEAVIDRVFGKSLGLSRKECEDAYVLAERHEDDHGNNPRSAWGFAAGVTRLSQQGFADKRDSMDRAAGKILDIAF